jgi:hypothetical protein
MAEGRKEEHEYLQVVARAGRLDFIPQERNRPAALPVSPNKVIAQRASTTAQTIQILRGQPCDPYYHSGLNE